MQLPPRNPPNRIILRRIEFGYDQANVTFEVHVLKGVSRQYDVNLAFVLGDQSIDDIVESARQQLLSDLQSLAKIDLQILDPEP